MADFTALYPIPMPVAKDRHVGKLEARSARILEECANRATIFRVSGPVFLVPAERFRPGSILHVLPATATGPMIKLPPAVEGVWFDIVNRSAHGALVERHGSDLIDGVTLSLTLAGTSRRFVCTAAGHWSALVSS